MVIKVLPSKLQIWKTTTVTRARDMFGYKTRVARFISYLLFYRSKKTHNWKKNTIWKIPYYYCVFWLL